MKKAFLDTNIVLDLLAERHPFYADAAQLFAKAERGEVQLFVSALTFANVNYILLKHCKPNEAKQILRKLKLLVSVLSLDDRIIDLSLNDVAFTDYEDALQYFAALENNMDVIVSRNLKDFRSSSIPVMVAGQFLSA